MHAAPIDRRDFLRRTALWGAALPFVGLARAAAAEQAGLVAERMAPIMVEDAFKPTASNWLISRPSMASAISG